MQFWFSRNHDVPIREQIVTQVVLGVLCGDLKPGERLPSTRELARRFHLHPNTISAAYKHLQKDGWVEFQHGSGVYVQKRKLDAPTPPALAFDQLLANLLRGAREHGIPLTAVHAHLRRWLSVPPPDRFLLIEPDEELRRIVVAEIKQVVNLPVAAYGLEACRSEDELTGAIAVALPSKSDSVRQALPAGIELITLQVRSVPTSLGKWLPAPADALVAVASHWPGFLKSAKTMLAATGFEAERLVFRDARERGWQEGLREMAAVVCDSVTAVDVPRGCRVIRFPLVSESALQELIRYQQFVGGRAPTRSVTIRKVP